ncbi:DUF4403 family protein [Spirosoma utsteinense]|uniref:DUF4403 family protein n=1 Tax=Spirosoma utsteinense TaxID=2585773 RepID=A0ABR6WDK3_9BACT|nr:DUF4403 family protein [Spirosoma utsteinense]MBC3785662.1 hypothetical protein [Spirosoma utsteinense]MBC3794604.1 hypothetical protein [Spirosoma utsteinense]
MSIQRTIGLLFFAASLFGAVCCKRVDTELPVTQLFEPAIADPVSFVKADITFNIRDLERKINKALNPVLVKEETFEGRKGEAWRLRVERTGPVRIKYANRHVSFSAPLQVWYSNPIGLRKDKRSRPLCALAVSFVSPLSVGPNWRLNTRVRLENYHWIMEPSVRLLGVKVGVKKLAESLLDKRRAEIEAGIDKAVHDELRLDREVSRIWGDMQKPMRISRQPEEIWLIPRPFSVAVAPVSGNAKQITLPVQIAFRVDTRLGMKPVVDRLEPLPRLLRRNHLPEAARLEVLVRVPYSDLNRVLAQSLNRQKLNLAGGHINIKNATIYGGGRSLILKANVGGSVNGSLYFRGHPAYDTLDNTLRVEDIDFDVVTKERLFATADWLLHDNLRDTLQSVLVVPLRYHVASIPEKIETAFARGKAGQKTALDVDGFRLVPQRIVIRPEGIEILIKVVSKVDLAVKQL